MTRHDIGAFLFGVGVAGVLFTCWAVVSAVWEHWLEEREEQRDAAEYDRQREYHLPPAERRAAQIDAEWRARYAAMPEAEKRAGAERLWAAVGQRCADCGPGYWIGDDGCRHTGRQS